MQYRGILLFYCCLLTLAGCQSALLQMKNDNSESELRIVQKEQRVSELELQNRSLQEKKTKLQKDLETTRLNLDQLSGRLKAIQMENDRIQAITPEQRKKQEQDSLRLKKYREEIELLMSDEQFAFDERGSKSEKQKRIDELREEIKLYLQFGLE
ncbi:MAG: hypothetical protein GY799_18805 [Desulfobulbaceae bacterium]|nr:hypothetical protein [Desulfobulbaceae bacterium]